VRTLALACSAAISLLAARPARADDAQPAARTWLWLSSSATLVCASLAGVYALQVEADYDRAQIIPGVSPERLALRHHAHTAELTADAFFIATSVFGISSLVLLITQPSAPAREPATSWLLAPSPHGASLVVRGRL
jgi:hypothetical protein